MNPEDAGLKNSQAPSALRDGVRVTLLVIEQAGGLESVQQVARTRGFSYRTASRHVSELVEAGLVSRGPAGSPGQGRSVEPSRTPVSHGTSMSYLEPPEEPASPNVLTTRAVLTEPINKDLNLTLPPSGAGARKRAPACSKSGAKPTGNHQVFVAWLHGEFLRQTGEKYPWAAKDFALVKRLLKNFDQDLLRDMTRHVMRDEWVQEVGFSLGILSSRAASAADVVGRERKAKARDKARAEAVKGCDNCRGVGNGCRRCRQAYKAALAEAG